MKMLILLLVAILFSTSCTTFEKYSNNKRTTKTSILNEQGSM